MFILFCDSKYRDLYGSVRVKQEIEKFFPNSVIVCNYHNWQAIFDQDRHIDGVFLNHFAGTRNRIIGQRVKQHGGKIFILPTEGRPDSGKPLDFIVKQASHPTVDAYFAWSKLVAKQYGEKAIVTGPARYTIYDKPEFLIDRQAFASSLQMEEDNPLVAITTNFPQAKFAYTNTSFNEADWKDLGVDDALGDPTEYAAEEYKQQVRFFRLVALTIEQYPGINFVIKPHPLEDHRLWYNFFATNDHLKNAHLYTKNIHTLVNACDMLISRKSCMTQLDAWRGGKPTIGIVMSGHDSFKESPPSLVYDASDPLYTFHSLIEFVLTEDIEFNRRQKLYLSKYGFVTKHDPAKAVAGHAVSFFPDGLTSTSKDFMELIAVIRDKEKQVGKSPYGHFDKNITIEDVNRWRDIVTL